MPFKERRTLVVATPETHPGVKVSVAQKSTEKGHWDSFTTYVPVGLLKELREMIAEAEVLLLSREPAPIDGKVEPLEMTPEELAVFAPDTSEDTEGDGE